MLCSISLPFSYISLLTFAAIGGVCGLTDHVAERFWEKKDLWNRSIGGFVACASIFGLRVCTISSVISVSVALATTAALVMPVGRLEGLITKQFIFPTLLKRSPNSCVRKPASFIWSACALRVGGERGPWRCCCFHSYVWSLHWRDHWVGILICLFAKSFPAEGRQMEY